MFYYPIKNPLMRNIMEQESNVISMEEVKNKKNVNEKVEKIFHITQTNSNQRECFVRVNVNKDITSLDPDQYGFEMTDLLDTMGVEWDGWSHYGTDYQVKEVKEVEEPYTTDGGNPCNIYDCSIKNEDVDGEETLVFDPKF
jgi:hypothetical protein